MRHARIKDNATIYAMSGEMEQNDNHEVDFHADKAVQHREAAASARNGGWFSAPNEEKAQMHEKQAKMHDAMEKNPEYHQREAAYHRKQERKFRDKATGFGAYIFNSDGVSHRSLANAENEKSAAETHEAKARQYTRDRSGKFA